MSNTSCNDKKRCGETCPVIGQHCSIGNYLFSDENLGFHRCCAVGLDCFDDGRLIWEDPGYCYDHYPRQTGEICRELYHCDDGLICDETSRTCRPKRFGENCGPNGNSSRPKDWGLCGTGLSCTDGKCYHDPRREGESCWDEDHLRCMEHLACRSGTCASPWEASPWQAWATTAAMLCLVLVACQVLFARCRRGRDYSLLEMDLAAQSANGVHLVFSAAERAHDPPSMAVFPYSYQEWKDTMEQYGHFLPPSETLCEEERRSFRKPCPFDIFLVYTGADKNDHADPMVQIFQSNGFRCFLDYRSIGGNYGAPAQQMKAALESCRYVVVLVSKRFLERDDPCAELEYAFERMLWIRENKGWESLRVVLLDLDVPEYKQYKRETRPSLPDLKNEIEMFEWKKGEGRFSLWSDLCHAVKADIFSHDLRGNDDIGKAVEKWRDLLRNWDSEEAMRDFPLASELYPAEDVV